MDRRDFLKSLAALGLVAASPRRIFDLGAMKFKESKHIEGFFMSSAELGLEAHYSDEVHVVLDDMLMKEWRTPAYCMMDLRNG